MEDRGLLVIVCVTNFGQHRECDPQSLGHFCGLLQKQYGLADDEKDRVATVIPGPRKIISSSNRTSQKQ